MEKIFAKKAHVTPLEGFFYFSPRKDAPFSSKTNQKFYNIFDLRVRRQDSAIHAFLNG